MEGRQIGETITGKASRGTAATCNLAGLEPWRSQIGQPGCARPRAPRCSALGTVAA